jgi:SAM-dependent MidA family methyltransferase
MNARTSSGDAEARGVPDSSEDSTLAERLLARTRREGPLTFRDWMASALYDEREGYYTRRGSERWGRSGDYRTSPERTPLFAATFARHFANLHEQLGSPGRLTFIEAGGGAGHFARALLDTLRRDAPRLYDSIRYLFDETGQDSRQRAAALLATHLERLEFGRAEDLAADARSREPQRQDPQSRELQRQEPRSGAFIVFSNELLDALPVHRVVVRGGRLRELYVSEASAGGFGWLEGEPSTTRLEAHFDRLGLRPAEGQFAEVCLEADEWVARVASLEGHGFVVTVDYGDDARALLGSPRGREGTLRAFSCHRFVEDLLANPGAQDLTATVNWTQLTKAGEAAGLETVALERLDAFLLRAGLIEQLERECALALDDAEVAALRLGAREMILPGGMGASFQVLTQKKPR